MYLRGMRFSRLVLLVTCSCALIFAGACGEDEERATGPCQPGTSEGCDDNQICMEDSNGEAVCACIPGTIGSCEGDRVCEEVQDGLPVCFAPAVVHLHTVPAHRKVNRVDMGTADKLCAVALGVWDQARRLGVPFDATSFEYLELGGAFTAVLAVRDGAVVDGAGGSSGPLGYLAAGALDGELAYLLGDFPKRSLASGGVAWVAGRPEEPPDVLAGAQDRRTATAWEAFFESVVKTVAGQAAVLGRPREILLSGRLGRVPWVAGEVTRRLGDVAPVRRVEGFAEKVKEAAQGAALIAQGLLGGESASLVEAMGIRAARGTVLDNLYVDGADEVRRSYRSAESDPQPLWERR